MQDATPLNDALFRQLLEHSAVGLATFSVGGRFLAANPALCRLLGYTESELLEKTHLDVIHIEDLEVAALTRVQAISGKMKPRILERRYMRKDGSTVWTHATGTVIRDDSGAALYTVLFVVDISTMKRALRTSEQRFRRMIEMSSDWYWVQDTEFRFIEVAGLESQDLDTDVVIGKARWELPNLGTLPEKVWEQHRASSSATSRSPTSCTCATTARGSCATSRSAESRCSTSRASSRATTASARTSPSGRATRRRWRTAKSATASCSTSIPSRCGWWTPRTSPFSR